MAKVISIAILTMFFSLSKGRKHRELHSRRIYNAPYKRGIYRAELAGRTYRIRDELPRRIYPIRDELPGRIYPIRDELPRRIYPIRAESPATCDCDCLFKGCESGSLFLRRSFNMTCAEIRQKCQECKTEECASELHSCIGKAQGSDVYKCGEEWKKCSKCLCSFKKCQALAEDPKRCNIGLDLCRRCETEECDAKKSTCLISAKKMEVWWVQGAIRNCVKDWYQCVLPTCRQEIVV